MKEKTLTRSPVEGLFQVSVRQTTRDLTAESFQRMGFEVQTWRVGNVFGFSYSKNRKLSKKQLNEFDKLEVDNGGTLV